MTDPYRRRRGGASPGPWSDSLSRQLGGPGRGRRRAGVPHPQHTVRNRMEIHDVRGTGHYLICRAARRALCEENRADAGALREAPRALETRTDVKEDEDRIVVTAEIPGIDPKDIHVEVRDDRLILEGRRGRRSRRKTSASIAWSVASDPSREPCCYPHRWTRQGEVPRSSMGLLLHHAENTGCQADHDPSEDRMSATCRARDGAGSGRIAARLRSRRAEREKENSPRK